MDTETQALLRMDGICKGFGGVQALKNVSLTVNRGEIHALIGENGAGKSTLIKILSGAYFKDSGSIYFDGEKIEIASPRSALDKGISVIYQELALIPHLTVAENIMIDRLEAQGIVNWKKIKYDSNELLCQLGFDDIDVTVPVSSLSVAYQQVVEIAKAISRDAKILVLDEPTSVLTNREVEKLFRVMQALKEQGTCIIYVSHRLEEIFQICDRITVLKDGCNVTTVNTADITQERLVTLMVGREISDMYPKRNAKIGEVLLEAKNLFSGSVVQGVSFEVRSGEVLGFSGLVGAGRTETMQAIFGAARLDAGEVFINGKKVTIKSPRYAVRYGLGMVPEDRKKDGVILNMPIYINGTISIINKLKAVFGRIRHKREVEIVNGLVNDLVVRTASIYNNVSTLSGGNQQKVSLMKWLAAEGRVLILDEPTRGVDVGAKIEIYRIINQLAEKGIAIIMVSSEMPEIIGVCDRVIAMRQGKVTGELSKTEITENNLIKLAMGVA